MEAITELANIDYTYVFISVFTTLIGIRAATSIIEWVIDRSGLETKWMRKRREDHELIKALIAGQEDRDAQIEALICANKELLGAEIDKRYKEYISLDGIPESDVDDFDDVFAAYKRLNGNHSRDTKYDYVKTHLHVIPVETKLIINMEVNDT